MISVFIFLSMPLLCNVKQQLYWNKSAQITIFYFRFYGATALQLHTIFSEQQHNTNNAYPLRPIYPSIAFPLNPCRFRQNSSNSVDGKSADEGQNQTRPTIVKDPKNKIKCFRIGTHFAKLENNLTESGFWFEY